MAPVLALAVAAVLSGCASSGPVFTAAQEPTPDQALLYFYRKADSFGQLVPVRVKVNGEEVARLPNNSYTYSYAPPGSIIIEVTPMRNFSYDEAASVFIRNTVAAGQTYFLKILQTPAPRFEAAMIVRVKDPIEAKPELADLPYEGKR